MTAIVIGLLNVLAVLIAGFIWAKRQRADFEQRFPPISDAEYVARFPPGTNPHVALKVREILVESLNCEYERIYPSSRLMGDLGAD